MPLPPPPQPTFKESLAAAREALTPVWWRFFDWLAVTPWKHVVVLALLILIVADMLHLPDQIFFIAIFSSVAVKIIAGGKRRSDIAAREATQRANHESMERRVAEAELAAMQAQIEPHFLFNTLGSIETLIEIDPPLAARTQRSLIQYLRAAMPQLRGSGNHSTLGQQVALSRAFLEIMKVRMEERLDYRFDIPDGLSSAEFPPMMLQTLVENSIKHGLEPKAEGGRIDIAAEIAHGKLRISVVDSGVGLADGPSPTAGSGVGLGNVRERLKLLFGKEARLLIESPAAGGTRAVIELPYRSLGPSQPTPEAAS
ncbi:histidine kinase [Chitinivorax sp. PXF-14]|uniref:sensor histidine kinase n=1 Tax=Chitinivorax sp. PXF-14 TaxID=3230488 RepID=UPI0034668B74